MMEFYYAHITLITKGSPRTRTRLRLCSAVTQSNALLIRFHYTKSMMVRVELIAGNYRSKLQHCGT